MQGELKVRMTCRSDAEQGSCCSCMGWRKAQARAAVWGVAECLGATWKKNRRKYIVRHQQYWDRTGLQVPLTHSRDRRTFPHCTMVCIFSLSSPAWMCHQAKLNTQSMWPLPPQPIHTGQRERQDGLMPNLKEESILLCCHLLSALQLQYSRQEEQGDAMYESPRTSA